MKKILIISANFYQEISKMLETSAIAELESENFTHETITVPGCLEIPTALALAIDSKKYDGYIVLGCVIRGETTHYDYVCNESIHAVTKLSLKHRAPIGNGILTVENQSQAITRADKTQKDKGGHAARTCIEMLKIKDHL